jgi:predicted nucleotidyltransferase
MTPAAALERQLEVDEPALLAALDATLKVIDDDSVDAVLMGGIASAVHGRPRWTHDLDVFTRPQHVRLLLGRFADAGFTIEEHDPFWLMKAFKDDVLVDVIFRSVGDLYLDDQMLARATVGRFRGRDVRVVSAEDLLVIKALAHAEHSPRHWHDALGIIARCELDWDYVTFRARHGPRRVLSLLLYAQSVDLPVPDAAVAALCRVVGIPTP